jgi:hypothetical protein
LHSACGGIALSLPVLGAEPVRLALSLPVRDGARR